MMSTPDARLRDLLTECLSRQDLATADGRVSISGDGEKVQAVWHGFQEFATTAAEHLYGDLRIPSPGRSDVDRLGFETRLKFRPAKPNIPARPPSAWLSLRVRLVDGDDEYHGSDETALRFVLHSGLPPEDHREAAIWGAGGPQSRQTGRDPGLPLWFRQVEAEPAWKIVTGHLLDFVEIE